VRLIAPKPTPYTLQPKTLGEHLKKRRCELGLLQKDVAVRLGICHETYIHWEKDQTKPYTASYGPLDRLSRLRSYSGAGNPRPAH
jgi:transcriptional regulator with XRE-family HTH domain